MEMQVAKKTRKILTCEDCGGKCCRYVAVELDDPTSKSDFEDMVYYLLHESVKIAVVVEDDEASTWYLEFRGVCRYLDDEGRCTIYEQRPRVCRDHAVEECEHHDAQAFRDIETVPQLFEFMREIGRKKWAKKLAAKVPEFLRGEG
jgi:Fe-S-cluster containining protein